MKADDLTIKINGDQNVFLIENADPIPLAKLVAKEDRQKLEDVDTTIWKTHGPAPVRDFPNFDPDHLTQDLEQIKQTLKDKIKKAKVGAVANDPLELKSFKKKGLLLVQAPAGNGKGSAIAAGPQDIVKDFNEADVVKIDPNLMEDYFKHARATLHNETKTPGIPHEVRFNRTGYWLPGRFVIDEVFNALLWTTYKHIAARNTYKQFSMKNLKYKDPFVSAEQRLNKFIVAISTGPACAGDSEEADNYIPFINYPKKEDKNYDANQETYIKLLKSLDDYVVGAIAHVGDWASGTHSNGSGIP
jgi:hypothetical protein